MMNYPEDGDFGVGVLLGSIAGFIVGLILGLMF